MAYFERMVSRRYLFSRERKALVSAITLISVAGVTVGVAALIIVIGVIDGIDRDIFGRFVEIHPHMRIASADDEGLADPAPVLAAVSGRAGIERAEPIIQQQVLLERGGDLASPKVPGQIIGADELGLDRIYRIPDASTGGNIRLQSREILLGAPLAYQLGAQAGDRIIATTGKLQRTPGGWMSRRRNLQVIGIFNTGMWEFDAQTAFVSTETAREVFGADSGADFVHIKLRDPFSVRRAKSTLQAELGSGYAIHTWEEQNAEFFQALKLEKLGLVVILLLVVIVASFNIIGTLILVVIEKTPEIGILKAVGASDRMIRRVFLNSGLTIGVVGTASGLVLGLIGCFLVKYVIRFDLPDSVYAMNSLPVVVKPATVSFIVASALAISLLAAIFPAYQASRLDAVTAIRQE
jgi:lipoprotein-releasing system permease protein